MENSRSEVLSAHGSKLDAPVPKVSVPVKLQERVGADITDVCDAPVSTEWFMHTNTFHQVAERVDVLFTYDNPIRRPLMPYTPAESIHCSEYK